MSISSVPFLIALILAQTLVLGCADPKALSLKAEEEIRANCKVRGCIEPVLIEVIVHGNLRQYKELAGIPVNPEWWEYLFTSMDRHERAARDFASYKLTVLRKLMGLDVQPFTSAHSIEHDDETTVDDQEYGGGTALGHSGLLGSGFLAPYTPNAYGPGLNMDATGRPFMWQPQWGGTGFPDPTLRVKPDAYGLGVGMDQYGRPVRPACPPGWAGPC